MGRTGKTIGAIAALALAVPLWLSTGDRPIAEARRIAQEIRAEAMAQPDPPPPLLAEAIVADTDPEFFARAAWRSPLHVSMAHMRLAETRAPRHRTLGFHLSTGLVVALADLSASHDDILSAYIGWAYFGRGCYGAERAAKGYFDKALSQATDAQHLSLAPLPGRPQSLDRAPDRHRDRVARIPTRVPAAFTQHAPQRRPAAATGPLPRSPRKM